MIRAVLFSLTLASALGATENPFPVPPPAPVQPVQPPNPGAVLNLSPDQYYVVSCKADAVLRVHPAGLVKVTKEVGPIRLRGAFVDGSGAVETRKYDGPTVYIVEALPGQKGRIELDLVPVAFKLETEILTATVDVNGGQAPQPPPKPVDPVDPKPVDPVPVKVDTFRVIWVFESGQTANVAPKDAKEVRDYLTANCTKEGGRAGFREYDPQQVLLNEQAGMKAVWDAAKPQLPNPFQNCVVIQVNSRIIIENLPADPKAAIAIFDKYLKGGK